ncbi:helix-turn-helix domain-containing protein [Rathayibacter soli]|uniref:helix-turn-helix domain-containing protein n=1 Tax=Rathayibacter soli TaxID=3144168 RepID=UPI0027E52131|nr:helix-turn-helix domain-containing protein [Glaciibacter superstes]
MLLRHAIGSALRRLRLQRGLTLRQLSERSRVSLPYLSEIERGRKEASSEILSTICLVLGISVPDLLRATDAEYLSAVEAAPKVLDLTTRFGVGSPIASGEPAGETVRHQAVLLAA